MVTVIPGIVCIASLPLVTCAMTVLCMCLIKSRCNSYCRISAWWALIRNGYGSCQEYILMYSCSCGSGLGTRAMKVYMCVISVDGYA